jgi:hypothetical protein
MILLFACALSAYFPCWHEFLFLVKLNKYYSPFVPFPVACASEVQDRSTQKRMEEMIEDSMKESLCKAHRHPAIVWHPALPVGIRTYDYDKGYEWCRDYLLKKEKEKEN